MEFPEGEDPSLYDMRIIECSWDPAAKARLGAAQGAAGLVAAGPRRSARGSCCGSAPVRACPAAPSRCTSAPRPHPRRARAGVALHAGAQGQGHAQRHPRVRVGAEEHHGAGPGPAPLRRLRLRLHAASVRLSAPPSRALGWPSPPSLKLPGPRCAPLPSQDNIKEAELLAYIQQVLELPLYDRDTGRVREAHAAGQPQALPQ